MTSIVGICNLALSNIRAKSINALTESSIEAQQCNLKYAQARDFLLRDTPWQFATKTVALALRTDEPLGWVYGYQYPSDALKVQYVTGDFAFKNQSAEGVGFRDRHDVWFIEPEKTVAYEINLMSDNNRAILTDQKEAYAVYTARVTDPNLYDPQFIEALSWYLSAQLAVPIMGGEVGRAMRSDALNMYNMTLQAAVANDVNEQKRPARKQVPQVEARTT